LAIEVAIQSNEFLGAKLHARSGRVVYINTEDGRPATGIAMKRLMKLYDLTEAQRDNILFIFEVDDMIGEINKKLIDPHIDLIIVDCWGDIFDGNPNDFVSVRKHMKELKGLAEKYDCCVLLLHHNVKNSEKGVPDKNKMNGSQAIGGRMRSLLELRLAEAMDERLLTILKANYVPMDKKNESLVLKFHRDTLLFTQENRRIPLM
jgi:RecA-family ATPase